MNEENGREEFINKLTESLNKSDTSETVKILTKTIDRIYENFSLLNDALNVHRNIIQILLSTSSDETQQAVITYLTSEAREFLSIEGYNDKDVNEILNSLFKNKPEQVH